MTPSFPRREEESHIAAEETLEWRSFKIEEPEISRWANRQMSSHLWIRKSGMSARNQNHPITDENCIKSYHVTTNLSLSHWVDLHEAPINI